MGGHETVSEVVAAPLRPIQERGPRGQVIMRSLIGASRIVDMLSGEQLPRIC